MSVCGIWRGFQFSTFFLELLNLTLSLPPLALKEPHFTSWESKAHCWPWLLLSMQHFHPSRGLFPQGPQQQLLEQHMEAADGSAAQPSLKLHKDPADRNPSIPSWGPANTCSSLLAAPCRHCREHPVSPLGQGQEPKFTLSMPDSGPFLHLVRWGYSITQRNSLYFILQLQTQPLERVFIRTTRNNPKRIHLKLLPFILCSVLCHETHLQLDCKNGVEACSDRTNQS